MKMETITINVQDELINILGKNALKKIINDELEYQKFYFLEKEIHNKMNETEENWTLEFEKIREEAYKEYKLAQNQKDE